MSQDKVEVIKGYYESGALWWETPYVNGKEHGIEKFYYESGALKYETPYVNGNIHGIEKSYYESGAIRRVIPHVNGEKHGIGKYYEIVTLNISSLTLYDEDREVASVKI